MRQLLPLLVIALVCASSICAQQAPPVPGPPTQPAASTPGTLTLPFGTICRDDNATGRPVCVMPPEPPIPPAPPKPQPLPPLPIPAPAPMWLPKEVYTAGAGITRSPNGTFVYASESTLMGAGTYATVAVEEVLAKGKITQLTLAGITKALYQFGPVTICLTGLGGGYTSDSGQSGGAASGQVCADVRIGKSAWGAVFTGQRLTTGGGWKFTLAPRFAR